MDIGFSSAQQMTPPQMAGACGVSAPPGTTAAEPSAQEKPALNLTQREIGASELAQVPGEERVDEAALRRDDDLGQFARAAFDPKTAAAALPPLGLGGTTPSSVAAAKNTAAAFQAMAESSYETRQTIIGNMVDSPEERAEKAAREAERQAKEFDEKMRLDEQTEALNKRTEELKKRLDEQKRQAGAIGQEHGKMMEALREQSARIEQAIHD